MGGLVGSAAACGSVRDGPIWNVGAPREGPAPDTSTRHVGWPLRQSPDCRQALPGAMSHGIRLSHCGLQERVQFGGPRGARSSTGVAERARVPAARLWRASPGRDARVQVRIDADGGKFSEAIPIEVGVLQGGQALPVLFNLCMEPLIRWLLRDKQVRLFGAAVGDLCYADDLNALNHPKL